MVADNHRVAMLPAASATAMTAMITASTTTVSLDAPPTISSTTRPASTGVATASSAPTTLSRRNSARWRRCGTANDAIRRNVARENGRFSSCAVIAL
jgi:hypothetical protein